MATYIAFLVLELIGALTALSVSNAHHIIRKDGSKPIIETGLTWKFELLGLYHTLRTDTYIIGLFPMFFASNFFYTYQFNVSNVRASPPQTPITRVVQGVADDKITGCKSCKIQYPYTLTKQSPILDCSNSGCLHIWIFA